jgi:hypothetical protein
VPGCKAARPHLENEVVQGIIRAFSDPVQLTSWVKMCIAELRNSVADDIKSGRLYGYITRWRQPEELYYRTLYVLFVAEENAVPHVLSGEMSNGFVAIWRRVNEVVFEGRGTLEKPQPGLMSGEFTAMETINSNAHASFASIITCIGLVRNPEYQKNIPQHLDHWARLCDYLNCMEGMFRAGKSKEHVLAGLRNMHKPKSAW